MKENNEINEETFAQTLDNKIIIPSPKKESEFKFSKPKLLAWKESKRDVKMLNRILSKRHVTPIQLINAQEFEYNEIESSVREASAPSFKFNEIYKKVPFIMDSKILDVTIPATGGETNIRLITLKEVSEAFQKKYSYMHIGAVQVLIELLARDEIDCLDMCILQDDRLTYFKKSLL